MVDLQDAAVFRSNSGIRAVQDRRSVQPDIASFGQAPSHTAPPNDLGDGASRDAPCGVRPGCDEERSIGHSNISEVDPQGIIAASRLNGGAT